MHLRFRSFFGLIFRPNFLGPNLTTRIFRTVWARRAKFGIFLLCRSSTKCVRNLVYRYRRGRSGAPQNWKKIEISKFLPSLAVSGGKYFSDFGSGWFFRDAYCLMWEQNEAGLLSTVSPPEGAKRGPIEKFAPHSPQNLGLTPNFKILRYGDPHFLQILEISWKNLRPF